MKSHLSHTSVSKHSGKYVLSDYLGMLTFDLKKDVMAAELAPHVNNIRKMMDTKKKMRQIQVLALGWIQVNTHAFFSNS